MAKASWLRTRVEWHPVTFDDSTVGSAALFTFRYQRLPLLVDLDYLLVAINSSDRTLSIYKHSSIPAAPLSRNAAILILDRTSFLLTALDEYFDSWLTVEAIVSAYTRTELSEGIPPTLIADAIMRRWREDPVAGWLPTHRGSRLGLSFLREATDIRDNSSCSIEVTATKVLVYQGPIADNDALSDHRVIKIWNLHDLDVPRMRKVFSIDDLVQVRLLMRRYRLWLYEYVLSTEMPF